MTKEEFEKLLDQYRQAVLDLDVLTEIEEPGPAEIEMEEAARKRERSAYHAIMAAWAGAQ